MEFNPQEVVMSTQKQLLDVWFEVYLLQGHRVSQAARRSHARCLEYLRAVGVPESDLATLVVAEEEWVQTMLTANPIKKG